MTLLDAIHDLDSLDEESTIYAAEPWSADSQVLVAREPDVGGLPTEAARLGLTYFLEVFMITEFLEGWTSDLHAEPTAQEKVARLIRYAIDDA